MYKGFPYSFLHIKVVVSLTSFTSFGHSFHTGSFPYVLSLVFKKFMNTILTADPLVYLLRMEKMSKEFNAVSTTDIDPQFGQKYKVLRSRMHVSTPSAFCQSKEVQ